ncbi:guanylate kinase, partial [Helicosporidium sp. ATCC 50920]
RPDLHFVVTATTRAPRPGETDGVDYHFVDRARFESWIQENSLLEHARVYGEWRGIPRTQVDAALRRGTDCVLRLDVRGAARVKALLPNVVTVFVAPESERALRARLERRGEDSPAEVDLRLRTVQRELEAARAFDFVVVNAAGRCEEAVEQLDAILTAEKARGARLF